MKILTADLNSWVLNWVLLILTGYADGFYGEPDIIACPMKQSKEEEPGESMLWYKFACLPIKFTRVGKAAVMSPACDIAIHISLILFFFNIFAISYKRDLIVLASMMPVELKSTFDFNSHYFIDYSNAGWCQFQTMVNFNFNFVHRYHVWYFCLLCIDQNIYLHDCKQYTPLK